MTTPFGMTAPSGMTATTIPPRYYPRYQSSYRHRPVSGRVIKSSFPKKP